MQPNKIVAVKFGESDKTYDFFAGAFDVAPGQRVMVPMRGREISVTVAEVKTESELAKVAILRIDVRTDEQRAAKHPNGVQKWSPDGTLLDENGNRSIFDDVDQ
ncbi:primosomal protein N' family DNA-binding protein [Mesorhizobium sp. P5_C1]